MKPKRKRLPKSLTLKEMCDCATILRRWAQEIRRGLDLCHPGWEKRDLTDLTEGYQRELQTYRLLQSLQVSMLDKMQTIHMLTRFKK